MLLTQNLQSLVAKGIATLHTFQGGYLNTQFVPIPNNKVLILLHAKIYPLALASPINPAFQQAQNQWQFSFESTQNFHHLITRGGIEYDEKNEIFKTFGCFDYEFFQLHKNYFCITALPNNANAQAQKTSDKMNLPSRANPLNMNEPVSMQCYSLELGAYPYNIGESNTRITELIWPDNIINGKEAVTDPPRSKSYQVRQMVDNTSLTGGNDALQTGLIPLTNIAASNGNMYYHLIYLDYLLIDEKNLDKI